MKDRSRGRSVKRYPKVGESGGGGGGKLNNKPPPDRAGENPFFESGLLDFTVLSF